MEWIARKGRSGGDAGTEMVASFYCINTPNPGRNKLTHIYLVYLQKRNQQRTSDKVENETENKMKSEPQPEQVHTKKRRKENKINPQATKKMFIVLRIYNHISQATNC